MEHLVLMEKSLVPGLVVIVELLAIMEQSSVPGLVVVIMEHVAVMEQF